MTDIPALLSPLKVPMTLPDVTRAVTGPPPLVEQGVEPPYRFVPHLAIVAKVPPSASIAELEAEPGMYSATTEFVRAHGGPIANRILDAIPCWYLEEAAARGLWPNIDVRIHRLYPGDFPAYPGWHCDGEYRETYFSQPDLLRIPVSRHIVTTVSSPAPDDDSAVPDYGVSNTQFLAEPYALEPAVLPTSDHTLWGQTHRALVQREADGTSLALWDSRDGELLCFDSRSLHRALPATRRGWRMFFRLAMWHRPNLGEGGMMTRQEQVYKLVEGSGW